MGIHSEDIPMGDRLLLQVHFSQTRRSAAVPNQVFLKKCMKICCSSEDSTPLKCPKQVAVSQFVLNTLTLNQSSIHSGNSHYAPWRNCLSALTFGIDVVFPEFLVALEFCYVTKVTIVSTGRFLQIYLVSISTVAIGRRLFAWGGTGVD